MAPGKTLLAGSRFCLASVVVALFLHDLAASAQGNSVNRPGAIRPQHGPSDFATFGIWPALAFRSLWEYLLGSATTIPPINWPLVSNK